MDPSLLKLKMKDVSIFVDSGNNNPLTAGGGNNIYLYANTFGNGIGLSTSGEVFILSGYNTSDVAQSTFSSSIDLGYFSFASSITGLTVGLSTNTADISITSNVSINGPITMYGGTLSVAADMTSTTTSGIGIRLTGTKITPIGRH